MFQSVLRRLHHGDRSRIESWMRSFRDKPNPNSKSSQQSRGKTLHYASDVNSKLRIATNVARNYTTFSDIDRDACYNSNYNSRRVGGRRREFQGVVDVDFEEGYNWDKGTSNEAHLFSVDDIVEDDQSDQRLEVKLREYRMQQNMGSKSYLIYNNAMIKDLISRKPTTIMALSTIKGFGSRRIEKHGYNLVSIIKEHKGISKDDEEHEPQLSITHVDMEDVPKFNVKELKDHLRDRGERLGGKKAELQSRLIAAIKRDLDTQAGSSSSSSSSSSATTSHPPLHMSSDLPPLNHSQSTTVNSILSSPSHAFVSGPAGSGKSHVLKHIIRRLSDSNSKYLVCAPTGAAALNVKGRTIHNLLGLSPYDTSSPRVALMKVKSNVKIREELEEVDVLVLDECSMLSREVLEILEMCLRKVRGNEEPAGGVKVILFGDFFQLPPVDNSRLDQDERWCFLSESWKKLGLDDRSNHHVLKEIERQKGDSEFIRFLNKVRIGDIFSSDVERFNDLVASKGSVPSDGIVPTRLFCFNENVDKINNEELNRLDAEMYTWTAIDQWATEPPVHSSGMQKKLKNSLAAEAKQKIQLKVGAQVMLSRNHKKNKNLVNGSRGVVVGFDSTRGVRVKFDNGLTCFIGRETYQRSNPNGPGVLVRKQIPLKLAWATTIHKSQGSTLTRASLSVNDAFDYGQAYVALSRVRGIEGLWLEERMKLGMKWCEISPSVVNFYGLEEREGDEEEEEEGRRGGEESKEGRNEAEKGGGLHYASIDHFGTPIYTRMSDYEDYGIEDEDHRTNMSDAWY